MTAGELDLWRKVWANAWSGQIVSAPGVVTDTARAAFAAEEATRAVRASRRLGCVELTIDAAAMAREALR